MKKRGDLRINLEFYATRLILLIIGAFPFALSLQIGEKLGLIIYFAAKKLRRIGEINLKIAFPNLSQIERTRILRESFKSLGRQLGLITHFPKITAEKARQIIDFEGGEHFDDAKKANRGALLVTAHFGGWELINVGMSVFGYDGNILVRRIDNPKIEQLVEKLRTKFGSKTIDKMASARLMFKVLRNGERLGIVADQNAQPHEAVFVDFFNVPASTTNGVAKLALRTNSVILPTFAIWQPQTKRYLLKIEPPIEHQKSGDNEKDVLELTQNFTKSIENIIKQYPEQWLWIHKRWNTRPNGKSDFYDTINSRSDFANDNDAAILRENLRK